MALSHYVLYQSSFLVLFSLPFLWVGSRLSYRMMGKAFAFGFIGWLLAFLRIILIQLYQIFILVQNGVDFTDPNAVANSPVILSYEFNLIGPLLSGLFEEPVRYLLLFASLKDPSDRKLRKYVPLVFGLGWAYSEIMVVTLGFLNVTSVDSFTLSISMYERVVATILHVCLTYVVLYAKIDRKRSLLLAILVHDFVNTALLVMLIELRNIDPISLSLLIEGILTLMVALFVAYAWIHVRKREDFLEKAT